MLDRLVEGRDDEVVRRGGETFVTPGLAIDVIDQAAALGVKPLGLEGFLVSDEAVYPAMSRIADASSVPDSEAASWLRSLLTGPWATAPAPSDQIHGDATGRHMVVVVLGELSDQDA